MNLIMTCTKGGIPPVCRILYQKQQDADSNDQILPNCVPLSPVDTFCTFSTPSETFLTALLDFLARPTARISNVFVRSPSIRSLVTSRLLIRLLIHSIARHSVAQPPAHPLAPPSHSLDLSQVIPFSRRQDRSITWTGSAAHSLHVLVLTPK